MSAQRWAERLLLLYPRAWRVRYGHEMTALLAQHRVTIGTLADLALGAVDAHLQPSLAPEGVLSATQRLRSSEVAVFVATVVFGVAWVAMLHSPDPPSLWHAAAAAHPALLPSFTVLEVAGLVACVAGAAALALLLRPHLSVPLRNAALSAGMWVGLTGVVFAVSNSRPGTGIRPLRTMDFVLEVVWLLATAVVAVSCTVWLATAARQGGAGERRVRLALWPSVVAGSAMVIGLGATVLMTVVAPEVNGPIAVVPTLMMAAGVVLAGSALRRARRVWPRG